ncbi:hypothetical protein D3C74_345040 [compost metagenome]
MEFDGSQVSKPEQGGQIIHNDISDAVLFGCLYIGWQRLRGIFLIKKLLMYAPGITNRRQEPVAAIFQQIRSQLGQLLQIYHLRNARFRPEELVRIANRHILTFNLNRSFNAFRHVSFLSPCCSG